METNYETKHLLIPIYPHGQLDSESHEHYPSTQVIAALESWGRSRDFGVDQLMKVLRWDSMMGCYCFGWAGMFLGVELDGHIHT